VIHTGMGEEIIGFWLRGPKVRDHWEELGVGGRTHQDRPDYYFQMHDNNKNVAYNTYIHTHIHTYIIMTKRTNLKILT